MFFTRSVSGKLSLGLAIVFVLVAALMFSSFRGVRSIQATVSDLELSVGKLPRSADLIASLSLLFAPLTSEFPGETTPLEVQQAAADHQREQFSRVFEAVRTRVEEFTQSWQQLDEKLRHPHAEQLPYRTLLLTAEKGLQTIQSAIPGLSDLGRREVNKRVIMQTNANVIEVIRVLPDPANRLSDRLREAKYDALQQHRLVIVLGMVSVVLLIVQMTWYYRLIFVPITTLYKGVRRLAAGDYGYRVDVPTKCEIGQLADAFNEMSSRIQEDRQSKQREIEERSKQLVRSERLAGAGFLASGVAHEINNPLSVIMTAAYGLEMRLGDDVLEQVPEADRADIREYLGLIQTESERCERITKKLLDFSYGKGDERNRYDVAAIVQEVVSMVSHLSRYQDRQLIFDHPLPLHAWVNAPEIKQVILNLVANALDATSSGGRVEIQVKEFPDQVEIAVEDNGCGMTPEQMKHIFEPFFTTKDVGKGTGLGLAITHRIVRDHGGTLEVTSEGTGLGSRFVLRLPKHERGLLAA